MQSQFRQDLHNETLQKVLNGQDITTNVTELYLSDDNGSQFKKKVKAAICQKKTLQKTTKQHMKIQD